VKQSVTLKMRLPPLSSATDNQDAVVSVAGGVAHVQYGGGAEALSVGKIREAQEKRLGLVPPVVVGFDASTGDTSNCPPSSAEVQAAFLPLRGLGGVTSLLRPRHCPPDVMSSVVAAQQTLVPLDCENKQLNALEVLVPDDTQAHILRAELRSLGLFQRGAAPRLALCTEPDLMTSAVRVHRSMTSVEAAATCQCHVSRLQRSSD